MSVLLFVVLRPCILCFFRNFAARGMSNISFKRVTFSPLFFHNIGNARIFGNHAAYFLPHQRYVSSALPYVARSSLITDIYAAVWFFLRLYAAGKRVT